MGKKKLETNTAILPDLGLRDEAIPEIDVMKIAGDKEAFIMFVNLVKSRDATYIDAMEKLRKYEKKAEDRKSATIIMLFSEIILAMGTGGFFYGSNFEYALPATFVILTGILVAILGLYFNFKE